MNHYSARKRNKDGRFDFTCTNNGQSWPVGYCRPFRPFKPDEIKDFGMTEAQLAEHESHKASYHDCGHDTAEEACACYRKFLLDTRLRFTPDRADARTQSRCKVCDVFTSGYAEVDHGEATPLCAAHRTREEVEKFYPKVSWIYSSC